MSSKTKTTGTKEEATPALVPKLRFPEFRGAKGWQRRQLVDVCSKITQGGTPDTSKPEYWGGTINWMTPAEMGKTESLFIGSTNRTITELGLGDCSSDLLPLNTVILSVRAPIGHLAINTVPMAINQGCKGLIPGKSLDFYFLLCSLLVAKTRLIDLGAGNTFKELSGSALKSFQIPVPSPPEQQKIASCLSSVDELMAAQARKVDALKTHKKGLMQQLFPREGETQPRLRFPEFQNAGEWEVKRVDEQGSVLAGKALAVDAPSPQRPYLRTKNVLDGAIDLSDVLRMPMTDAEFTRFEILDGDVLLNEGQSLELVGRASIYRGEFGKRCAMQNALLRFRAFPSTSAEFAAQYFRQCQKDGTFANVATKTTSVAHLGSSRFSALELAWPKPAEQHRIASCLTSLDALITTETRKHEALKTHKRGLMQQLFPSPEELAE